MYDVHTNEANKTPFLLLAFLLHLLMLLLFFILPVYQKKQKAPEIVITPDQLPDFLPEKEVARLKPRSSSFGAPIVMLDEPAFVDEETEDADSQDIRELPEENLSQEFVHDAIAENESKAYQAIHKEPEESLKDTQPLLPSFVPEKAQENRHLKDEATQKSSITKNSQEQAPIVRHTQPSAIQQLTRTQQGTQSIEGAPIKKELTLADLAKGFLNSIKQEGQDWLERDGNDNIRPDKEELKFLSYKRKVAWFIQNAMRTEREEFQVEHFQKLVTTIQMTVDKEGNLIYHKMIKSSGNYVFDAIVMRCTKEAAPYPPLPERFNMTEFPMYWSIYTYAGPQGPSMNFTMGKLR